MVGSFFTFTFYTPIYTFNSIPSPKMLWPPKPHQLHPQLLRERLAHMRHHSAEAPHPFTTTPLLPLPLLLAPLPLPPPPLSIGLRLGRRDLLGVVRDRGGGLLPPGGAALEDGFDPLVGAVRALVG